MTAITIPAGALEIFAAQFARFQRRAEGAGHTLAPYILTRKRMRPGTSKHAGEEVVDLEIDLGGLCTRGDYRLAGKVSRAEGFIALALAPEHEDAVQAVARLGESRKAGWPCDHCGTVRARNEVAVLKRADGSYLTVGTSCLDLVTNGVTLAHAILAWDLYAYAAATRDWGGEGSGDYYRPSACSLRAFLALVMVATTNAPYIGRVQAREQARLSTADEAWESVRKPDAVASALAEYGELADRMVQWAEGIAPASSYEVTLQALAQDGYVTNKTAGYAASLPTAYDRANAPKADASRSVHVGKVGERFGGAKKGSPPARVGVVMQVHTFETLYGFSTLVRVLADDGNAFMTFASAEVPPFLKTGARVALGGTVKAHEADRKEGYPVTVLSRATFDPA